jgi:hypothetical protein
MEKQKKKKVNNGRQNINKEKIRKGRIGGKKKDKRHKDRK